MAPPEERPYEGKFEVRCAQGRGRVSRSLFDVRTPLHRTAQAKVREAIAPGLAAV